MDVTQRKIVELDDFPYVVEINGVLVGCREAESAVDLARTAAGDGETTERAPANGNGKSLPTPDSVMSKMVRAEVSKLAPHKLPTYEAQQVYILKQLNTKRQVTAGELASELQVDVRSVGRMVTGLVDYVRGTNIERYIHSRVVTSNGTKATTYFTTSQFGKLHDAVIQAIG